MSFRKFFLYPLAVIYDLVTRFRNHLYDIAFFKSFDFDRPVICVGNLSLGGTGKTPMIIFLVEYLIQRNYKVAVLSRGYGKSTRGFRFCTEVENANTVGDEPYMLFKRFSEKVVIAVGEDRLLSIPLIIANYPETQIILLDDGFQHRTIKPDLNILLTTARKPFWKDHLFPAGTLRESKTNASRADVLIITKGEELETVPAIEGINEPIFLTNTEYGDEIYFTEKKETVGVLAVAGIADDSHFFKYLKSKYAEVETMSFPDHYRYTLNDVKKLAEKLDGRLLLTTEKDAVKLEKFEALFPFSCAYIPISHSFL
ncbi:MAG: tetraacyldisaccharide 4'-kinase, partial [Bacteroidota bacterium]